MDIVDFERMAVVRGAPDAKAKIKAGKAREATAADLAIGVVIDLRPDAPAMGDNGPLEPPASAAVEEITQ